MASAEVDTSALPIIDLRNTSNAEGEMAEVAKLRKACLESGFFYVIPAEDHHKEGGLVDSTFAATRDFFKLPMEVKMRTAATKDAPRGYTPYQSETLDPATQKEGDTKEGFYLGRELEADEPENPIERRDGNKWPDESAIPHFRRAMQAYHAALHETGKHIVDLLGLALDLGRAYFNPYFTHPMETLRLVHYFERKSQPEEGLLACGAHCDYGMITILLTDGVPGLEVFLPGRGEGGADGGWVAVPHVPGAYIVNLGDMLQQWTNGMFRSTLHRVVNRHGKERYSIPFFIEPNFNAVVECLSSCLTKDRPEPRHPPIKAGDYLLAKYAATYKDRK